MSVELYTFDRFKPDQGQVSDSGLDYARNAIYLDGSWQALSAPSVLATAAHGGGSTRHCTGLFETCDENGERIVFGSLDRLYSVDPATGLFTDRSRAGNYSNARWTFAKFGSKVIGACGANPVQLVNFGGASTDVITAPASKPQGRFIATIRSRLVMANIVAPAVDPRQWWWSKIDDETNWDPTAGAGFAFVKSSKGIITGLAGFEDFGVLFTTDSVYRLSYLGGSDLWDLQQIAGVHDGLPNFASRSIACVGRDVYYIGRSGPKVVRGGEQVEDLANAEIRRAIVDSSVGYSRNDASVWAIPYADTIGEPAYSIWGASDSLRRIVAWTPIKGNLAVPLGSQLLYSVDDDAWSLHQPGFRDSSTVQNVQTAVVSRLGAGATGATDAGGALLSGLLWGWNKDGSTYVSHIPSTETTTQGARFETKLWRHSNAGPKATQINGVRLWWRRPNDAIPVPSMPLVTFTIESFTKPSDWPTAVDSLVVTDAAANLDANGFVSFGFPKIANLFRFSVTIASGSLDWRDLMGLEILADPV